MKRLPSARFIIALITVLAGLGILVLVLAIRAYGRPARAVTPVPPTPTAITSSIPAILERPVVSNPPTQVEEGSLIFWGVCMACHGNEGQGLTDKWREDAFGEDKDCWASKCHAANHPPQGFEFPKIVPALAGGGRLGRFASAQQLYDYVIAMMPWWNPGSLTPEKGWQVTAYLLELNGKLPAGVYLNGTVASAVPVHRALSLPANDSRFALTFTGLLVLTTLVVVLREALQARKPVLAAVPSASARRVPARRPNFIAHLHPPAIPAEQARWRYTLGAGGTAVFLCLVLLITGLLEMFYYVPTPEQAAVTVETIQTFVPFGALVRSLHYWSAQFLVVVAGIHLLRVVLTGAYTAPRRFNYLLGMGLFVFVLLLDFTGYVLRWDEGIRWALTAGTNLLSSVPGIGPGLYKFAVGGVQVGPATLVRFYTWHIFVLSAAAAIVVIWHVFRVRRDGGIAIPAPQPAVTPARIPRSRLLQREVFAMFVSGILLLLVSVYIPAPIAAPLQGSPNLATDTRAPWFFLWVQQLLKLGDPFLLGALVPLVVLVLVALIPYILPRPAREEIGRWFPRGGRLARLLVILLALTILGLTLVSLLPTPNV